MVHSLSLALRGTTKANWLKEQFRNFVTLCISLIFCAIILKKKTRSNNPLLKTIHVHLLVCYLNMKYILISLFSSNKKCIYAHKRMQHVSNFVLQTGLQKRWKQAAGRGES